MHLKKKWRSWKDDERIRGQRKSMYMGMTDKREHTIDQQRR